jgi:hypothetical protein
MPPFVKRLPFEAWLTLAVLAAHLYAAAAPPASLLNWFHSDDAFYYFKTAQNISEGYGITFDRLGRDGGFHPLWMAICVPMFALARLDLMLPLRLVVMAAGLLNAGTGILVYRVVRRALTHVSVGRTHVSVGRTHVFVGQALGSSPSVFRAPAVSAAAALAGTFFSFYPPIHAAVFQMGLESGLSAFSLALLIYAAVTAEENLSGKALVTAGVCAALAVMARLDNVFAAAALGAWLVLRPRAGWPRAGRVLVLADLVLIVLGYCWRISGGWGLAPVTPVTAPRSMPCWR